MELTEKEKDAQRKHWIERIVYDLKAGTYPDTLLQRLAMDHVPPMLEQRFCLMDRIHNLIKCGDMQEEALEWWLEKCDQALREQLMNADLIEHGFDPFDKPEFVGEAGVARTNQSYRFVIGTIKQAGEIECSYDFNSEMIATMNRTVQSPFALPALRVQRVNRRYRLLSQFATLSPLPHGALSRGRVWKLDQLSRVFSQVVQYGLVPTGAKDVSVIVPVRQGKRAWWVAICYCNGSLRLSCREFAYCGGVTLLPGSLVVTCAMPDEVE